MENEKALALRELINDGYNTFSTFCNAKNSENLDVENAKIRFTSKQFADHYNDFIEELNSNILAYKNFQLIKSYFTNSFMVIINSNLFNLSYDHSRNYDNIFKNGIEVSYKSELFNNLIFYSKQLLEFYEKSNNSIPTGSLFLHYKKIANDETDYSIKPIYEDHYNVSHFKDWLWDKETIEKIKRFTDLLYDFKQWQIEFDKKIETPNGIKYKYTEDYYPNFEVLCNLELERLYKKLEIEKEADEAFLPTVTNNSDNTKLLYRWNLGDTDLLELITALYHSNSIKRKDNRKITRKELMIYFQEIFDTELKHAESKLSHTSDRKKTLTPYLDKLKNAFETFVEEKDDKQRERR